MVSARAAFAAVDPALEDVSATLGHGPMSRAVRVALPAAFGGIRAGMLLAWLRAFGEFGATVVLAYHPYSLPVFVYVQFGSTGLPSTTMYVATKAALRSMVRVMASEFGPLGIRVNTVSPGSILTPLHSHSSLPPEARDQTVAAILGRTPAGRFGNADEVAKAVLFLASDDAAFIQGEELVVSGGWSAV